MHVVQMQTAVTASEQLLLFAFALHAFFCLYSFRHLKLEIALAIPALNVPNFRYFCLSLHGRDWFPDN